MKPRLIFSALLFLSLVAPRLAAYDIKLYPASKVYDADRSFLHERLGLERPPSWVEEFEDDLLESWLTTNVKAGGHPTSDSAWVGNKASRATDRAVFEIRLPQARVFGVGLSGAAGAEERLSINGGTAIELKRFPGFEAHATARAFYLFVLAQPNDPDIHSIVIDRGNAISFDHLVVLESKETAPGQTLPQRLVVSLLGSGERVVGLADTDLLSIFDGKEERQLSLTSIDSLRCQAGGARTTIKLRNGEMIFADLRSAEFPLRTPAGEVRLAREAIADLKVTPRGEFSPLDERPLSNIE